MNAIAREPFGFINACKPPGPSATAFGLWVRRRFDGAALGHWGTLDPAAGGVLPLAVGRATRLLPFLLETRKRYSFILAVGVRTDTGDARGDAVETAAVPSDWQERLVRAAASLVGRVEYAVPAFSAVKVDGRPLYARARRGEPVEPPTRTTTVHELRVLDVGLREARLAVECDAGTYVRALCEELGRRVGTPAHMKALVRTAAGPFAIEAARLPAEIAADPFACLIDPLRVLKQPQVELDVEGGRAFAHGKPVKRGSGAQHSEPTLTALVTCGGKLYGVGRLVTRDGAHYLEPLRVLTDPAQGRGLTEAKD